MSGLTDGAVHRPAASGSWLPRTGHRASSSDERAPRAERWHLRGAGGRVPPERRPLL